MLLKQPDLLNRQGIAGLAPDLAQHITISFLTYTDQQNPGPETTLVNLTQLKALQFLMNMSTSTGLAVGFAIIRGSCGCPWCCCSVGSP